MEVSETMFDDHEKFEKLAFLSLGTTILTLAKTDWNSFLIIFDELSRAFFVFLYDQ